jgi:hypothetical protein
LGQLSPSIILLHNKNTWLLLKIKRKKNFGLKVFSKFLFDMHNVTIAFKIKKSGAWL